MRFYSGQHQFYCGVDLHANAMYLCVLSHTGDVVLHRNIKTRPQLFLKAIASFRDDLVVAAECIFSPMCHRQ